MRGRARLGHEVLRAASASPHPPGPTSDTGRCSVWLHGILGSRKNWRTPARKMVSLFPQFHAVVVDHRGHGSSDAGSGPHSLDSCAADLHHLIKEELQQGTKPPTIVSGHSFGGKVALAYAQACMEEGLELPRHTWVFDSLPCRVDRHKAIGEQSVAEVIEKLTEVQMPYASKDELANHLIRDKKIPRSIAQWLMTSLDRAPDGKGYVWAFSLPVIQALFDSYTEADYMDLLAKWPQGSTVNLIRAAKNTAWTPELMHQLDLIQRDKENVQVHTLNAGHWVHVDDPEGLIRLISPSFERT